MKPILASVKGKMVSLESTINGYTIEVMDVNGKYVRCFIQSENLSKFSSQFGQLKPNRDVKIKGSKDLDFYGGEIFHIEHVKPLKKGSGQ
jgi:hypothetical protein